MKQRVKEKCEEDMKMVMREKTKQKKLAKEKFELKEYVKNKSVEDV